MQFHPYVSLRDHWIWFEMALIGVLRLEMQRAEAEVAASSLAFLPFHCYFPLEESLFYMQHVTRSRVTLHNDITF
jgi:hypothetical protein